MDADNPFSPISEDNDALNSDERIKQLQEENIFDLCYKIFALHLSY